MYKLPATVESLNCQWPGRFAASCTALLVLLIVMVPFASIAEEQGYSDSVALGDLKAAKGVFWLSLKDPKKTAKYLQVITATHQGFVDQGVEPDLVVMLNGPMVAFLTTEPKDELALEYGRYLKSISKSVTKLNELGVRMEVCGVATKMLGVDLERLIPGLVNVRDGAISLIGGQYQGYRLVPIF
jgi:intracellular sulfur oxidation DsrE/DsrF family protein